MTLDSRLAFTAPQPHLFPPQQHISLFSLYFFDLLQSITTRLYGIRRSLAFTSPLFFTHDTFQQCCCLCFGFFLPFPNHSPAYVNPPRDDDNDDADEYTESDAIPLVPEVFPQENTNNEATFGGNNNNNNVVTGGNNNRPTLSDGVWW